MFTIATAEATRLQTAHAQASGQHECVTLSGQTTHVGDVTWHDNDVLVVFESWDRGYYPRCLALADEQPRGPGYESATIYVCCPAPSPDPKEYLWLEMDESHRQWEGFRETAHERINEGPYR